MSAALGLSALLLASRIAYDTMRIAGAVFLVSMGARSLWRSRRANNEATATAPAPPADAVEPADTIGVTGRAVVARPADSGGTAHAADSGDATETAGPAEKVPMPAESRWRAYRLGLLTNFANPKAGVFAVSFLPQFVPHGARVLPVLILLSLIWALIDMVWYLSLIWLAGRAGARSHDLRYDAGSSGFPESSSWAWDYAWPQNPASASFADGRRASGGGTGTVALETSLIHRSSTGPCGKSPPMWVSPGRYPPVFHNRCGKPDRPLRPAHGNGSFASRSRPATCPFTFLASAPSHTRQRGGHAGSRPAPRRAPVRPLAPADDRLTGRTDPGRMRGEGGFTRGIP